MRAKQKPVALTIAGSDSGGGAGIQADLKTFAALGVHGTSVVTAITAQNPSGVTGVMPVTRLMVQRQMEAIFNGLEPKAIKTGMLYAAPIIAAVVESLERRRDVPLVVDPVMVATSGAVLLKPAALTLMKRRLIPLAALITPNLDEAGLLLGRKLTSLDHLRNAAREINGEYGVPVLLKGGHLKGMKQAVDLLNDGRDEYLLSARFVRGVTPHGAGCTYSAAITAGLARGRRLVDAVVEAKSYISSAISGTVRIGRFESLNW